MGSLHSLVPIALFNFVAASASMVPYAPTSCIATRSAPIARHRNYKTICKPMRNKLRFSQKSRDQSRKELSFGVR